MKKGDFFSNTSWLIIGSLARMLIQLIVGVISARYLGPQNYGVLNYVAAYICFFSVICELGLTITLVNQLVKNPEDEGKIIGSAILLRILASILSTSFLIIFCYYNESHDHILIITFIKSIGLIFDSFNTITYWYQANLQSKYTTLIEFIAYAMSSIYKILILIYDKNIFWFAAATTVDSILIAILLLISYWKKSSDRLSIDLNTCKIILKAGTPFIMSGVMIYIYGQTDRIMIGYFCSQVQVGYYSCAASICAMIGFIPQAIMNSSKSIIIESYKLDYRLFEERIRYSISAVLWVVIIYSVFLVLLGKYIIWILFGKAYLPALDSLEILCWSFCFSYIGTLRNIWLVCEDKKSYATYFSICGATINFILNYILIPIYGICGASFATLITQFFTSFFLPFIIPSTRRFSLLFYEAFILKNINIYYVFNRMLTRIRGRA